MSYMTERTVWPDIEVADAKRALLARFFELADLKAPEAGPLMAKEVFSSNAVLSSSRGSISGTEAISNSRKTAWDVIDKRQHRLLRVYTLDRNATDLMLLGELQGRLKSGREFRQEFTARATIVDGTSSDGPRLALYQVWADPTPMQDAMKL